MVQESKPVRCSHSDEVVNDYSLIKKIERAAVVVGSRNYLAFAQKVAPGDSRPRDSIVSLF
jgi:hypothetical protein